MQWTDEQIAAFLDEQLPHELMSNLERDLRSSEELRNRVAGLIRRRSHGGHTLSEIWRKGRLSCPSREELGQFLLGILDEGESGYIDFHLRTVGCRYCLANLDDIESSREEAADSTPRRRRFFESSAGYLNRPR